MQIRDGYDIRHRKEVTSALLDMEDDIEVVGQAGNGEQALSMIESMNPDICVLDIEMPKLSFPNASERC